MKLSDKKSRAGGRDREAIWYRTCLGSGTTLMREDAKEVGAVLVTWVDVDQQSAGGFMY
jgi:hypothetical protein